MFFKKTQQQPSAFRVIAYPDDALPSDIVRVTAANEAALYDLFEAAADTPSVLTATSFNKIIAQDPEAAFQQQCEAYKMLRDQPVTDDTPAMAQLWQHPALGDDGQCVAIYRIGAGSFDIMAIEFDPDAAENSQPFAVFYTGDPSLRRAPALALCVPDESSAKLELNAVGDEQAFNGWLPYRPVEGKALFAEAKNHIAGRCGCETAGPGIQGLGQFTPA